ncbi:Gfo/Idh/MocA family oxidoreductase [Granulicella sp. dw_53]|uniref:Gfo/Idh/MocA family protein n=1 Tax=Granulicella sp. dw_53 TaxID=2719792 RepID=UPI001C4A6144|nr:Gfo/Idh/MocA family oxidoreductase [Granulicella sp. dw_53]
MGLIGPGFIAPHHIDAVRRLGYVDVVAIAGSSSASAAQKAKLFNVARSYGSYQELIADPDISVIHNTTPSYLHLSVSLAILEAGKHVISDKPLAITAKEGERLRDAAAAAGVVNAVTFNYRGNPLVQQARLMTEREEIGKVFFIHGHYLQDWMTDDTVYSWRSDPTKGGVSSALADIGSHWCDLAEHISSARITAVLADLTTVVKTRYSAGGSAEAFSKDTTVARTPVEVSSEDLASVLVRFDNGAKGCLSVGQVLPGHKNGLEIELNGRTGSVRWNQERQNELWIGRHDQPNAVMGKDPTLMLPGATQYAHLPAGHQESWADAFRNVIGDVYEWVRTGEKPATVCTFSDAYRTCVIIEAMLKSHAAGGVWQEVNVSSGSEQVANRQEAIYGK